jgi:hypothetical protein
VLQHDHDPLAGLVLHLLLEGGAQRVQWVAARLDGLVGEEADPAQSGQDAVRLIVVGEGRLGRDSPEQVSFLLGRGPGPAWSPPSTRWVS